MMLYKRDYNILTSEEIKQVEEAQNFMRKVKCDSAMSSIDLNKYIGMLPDAFHYYDSLFPNNHICTSQFDDKKKTTKIVEKFEQLIKENVLEQQILNFIRDNEAYFIISSVLNKYDFGHHDRYIFREMELPPNFVVDYLVCGKNSGGFEFVFIELENLTGKFDWKNYHERRSVRSYHQERNPTD